MMKPKALIPGRVITQMIHGFDDSYKLVTTLISWMIISVEETTKRRHSKKTAPKDGWNVLMIRLGKDNNGVAGEFKTFQIIPDELYKWKSLF